MINASDANVMTSEAYNTIAEEKFKEFKERAEKYITKAISIGRWNCCIPCDYIARALACHWLKTYGYRTEVDFNSVCVDWSECE